MDSKKILVVEDSVDDAELIELALETKNISGSIDIVNNGEAALDYLFLRGAYKDRKDKSLPHLIILDLKMPKLSGHEVLDVIKNNRRTKKIPVVVFTSSLEESDLINSYETGANSYIQKPVSGDDFDKVVEQLGKYWIQINQLPPA